MVEILLVASPAAAVAVCGGGLLDCSVIDGGAIPDSLAICLPMQVSPTAQTAQTMELATDDESDDVSDSGDHSEAIPAQKQNQDSAGP